MDLFNRSLLVKGLRNREAELKAQTNKLINEDISTCARNELVCCIINDTINAIQKMQPVSEDYFTAIGEEENE